MSVVHLQSFQFFSITFARENIFFCYYLYLTVGHVIKISCLLRFISSQFSGTGLAVKRFNFCAQEVQH